MRDAAGLAEAFKITHVPTFIFLRGVEDFSASDISLPALTQSELGRITETPAISIEQDWVRILKNNSTWAGKMELVRQFSLLSIALAYFSTSL
ncbi:MAG: hypothetical protein ONB44_24335, partial [candidate division KSB1 bacterium]|nr:hypothetical protein [candidate division KSB1 bacterium]